MNDEIEWNPDKMLEVTIKQPDDFLKVRETLTRIGVASRKDKTLYQSCHILHKQGKYYIVHFKELFALDGKQTNLSENDIARRNTISRLLSGVDQPPLYTARILLDIPAAAYAPLKAVPKSIEFPNVDA